MKNFGFTLMETLVYIALFSLIMTGGFVTAFQLIQGNDALVERTTAGEEGNFIIKKMEWVLSGISNNPADIASPGANHVATSTILSIKKWHNGVKIPLTIEYNASKGVILIQENLNPPLPLSTSNVKVNNLEFSYISSNGNTPLGISVRFTLDGKIFTYTTYAAN